MIYLLNSNQTSNYYVSKHSLKTLKNAESIILKDGDYLHIAAEELENNEDFLKYIIKKISQNNIKINITTNSFKIIKKIDNLLDEETYLKFTLLDDGLTIDRSYINLNSLEKIKNIEIPITYVMWNIKMKTIQKIYPFMDNFGSSFFLNSDTYLSKSTINQIKEIVYKIKQLAEENDLEKILAISKYLQETVKYYEHDKDGLVESILLTSKTGVCVGIASATALLSNNPIMNLNTSIVRGYANGNHCWNIQTLNGFDYYIDNTWNITRNEKVFKKDGFYSAQNFSTKYTLFSENTYSHKPHSVLLRKTNFSPKDYSQEEIKRVMKQSKFY